MEKARPRCAKAPEAGRGRARHGLGQCRMPAPQPGPGTPPAPAHNGTAYWIKLSAQPNGSFTVTNTRNGFSKTYKTGPGPN